MWASVWEEGYVAVGPLAWRFVFEFAQRVTRSWYAAVRLHASRKLILQGMHILCGEHGGLCELTCLHTVTPYVEARPGRGE